MDVDIVIKIIVAVGLTGSVVGISIQLMRLLSAVTENVKDFRRVTNNLGKITDQLIEEQKMLDEAISAFSKAGKAASGAVEMVSDEVVKPLVDLLSFVKDIKGYASVLKSKFSKRNK